MPWVGRVAFLTIGSMLVTFVFEGGIGLNLSDEGFLWYGAQRVRLGEVPIRDFMSYDPGRYYLIALLMRLFGDLGLAPLRVAETLFQGLGIAAGLWVLCDRNTKPGWGYLTTATLCLSLWMHPRYKTIDLAISLLLILTFASWIRDRSSKKSLFTGIIVGLIFFFGRNHGLYGVIASVLICAWFALNFSRQASEVVWYNLLTTSILLPWSAGILIGLSPFLVLAIRYPGFSSELFQGVRQVFISGSTNLALPVPWPWRISIEHGITAETISEFALGGLFLMLVLFGIFAPISMFWLQHRDRKVAPSIVSASFLALPYAHYALSRADALHVSHGVLPGLMVLLVAVSKLRQIRSWYTWVLVIGVSAIICLPQHPFWMCRHHDECERVQVGAGEVEVPLRTKEHINLIRSLANRYAPNGESFIAAPYWPGAYSLLERKAPVWEIYAFAPRTPEFETNEIERIKQSKPEFAIICDLALDDKQELRFQSTHPVTFQFIRDHMTSGQPLDDPSLHLFVRKAKVTWNP